VAEGQVGTERPHPSAEHTLENHVANVAIIVSMTHPLFLWTPVDDLPRELQRIVASYLPPRHPVANLAWGMIIQYLTRTDRSWWYGPISQDDLSCTNLYFWNEYHDAEEGVGYHSDRADRISDLGYFLSSMWGRAPPDRPIKESEAPTRRLLRILRSKGIKVKRGLSMYKLHLTLTGGTRPARRWTMHPSSREWVRAE
jgi:hypothetical protein